MLPEPIAARAGVLRVADHRARRPGATRAARPLGAVAERGAGRSLPAGERARRTSLMAAPATTWIRELLAAHARASEGGFRARGASTISPGRCAAATGFCASPTTRASGGSARSGTCSSTRGSRRREHEPNCGIVPCTSTRSRSDGCVAALQWHLRIGMETGLFALVDRRAPSHVADRPSAASSPSAAIDQPVPVRGPARGPRR